MCILLIYYKTWLLTGRCFIWSFWQNPWSPCFAPAFLLATILLSFITSFSRLSRSPPGFSPAIFSSYLIPLPSGSRRGSLRRAVPRAMMSSLHHYILLLPFLVTISPKAKQKGGATQGPEMARRFEGCSGARLKYPQTHTRRLVPAAPHVNPTVLQLPPPSVPSKPCVH